MALSRRQLVLSGAAGALLCGGGPARSDEPVLTLRNPKIHGPHGQIQFTRDDLLALEQVSVVTGNAFIDDVSEFRGPSAHSVVDMIGWAGSEQIRLIAANEFFVEIEIDELARYGAILAIEMDGKPLSRRDKGPIWLMYPIDSYPELQDSVYNSRLIWQLRTIELF